MKKILLIFMFSIVFTCTLANSSKVEHKSYEIENKGENEYGNDYDSKDIIETC